MFWSAQFPSNRHTLPTTSNILLSLDVGYVSDILPVRSSLDILSRPNTLHKVTSPRSLIKTAICALFAASAIRQKSCFAIEESCTPCTCPGPCCDDDGCGCDVGGGGFRLWACWRKYCEGWFADGDGKGAELDVAEDWFRDWQGGIVLRAIIQST